MSEEEEEQQQQLLLQQQQQQQQKKYQDIHEVVQILTDLNLPLEIALWIIELAEYNRFETKVTKQLPVDGGNLNMLYLTIPFPELTTTTTTTTTSAHAPPTSVTETTTNRTNSNPNHDKIRIKRIEFTCISHDQGWSSYPDEQNTYNGSWTWGECSVLTNNQTEKTGLRHHVYTNLHAVSSWQTHVKVFDELQPGVPHPLITEFKPGDLLGFWILSRFPGWRNYVSFAEIKLEYQVSIC